MNETGTNAAGSCQARPLKIVVAVTGASGAIYARLLVERLLELDRVGEIGLIFSDNGREVAAYEGVSIDESDRRIRLFGNDDMFAPPASGSAHYDAMAVIPCSMGTVGRIATGVSSDLISRAADVMLKECRRLVVVPRETPLGTIHLRNLATLSECGARVVPASPSFYSHPDGVESLCMTVVDKVVAALGIEAPRYTWTGR